MKSFRTLLFISLAYLLTITNVAANTLEVSPPLSDVRLQGTGRLTWWGLHIYDASFYRLGPLSSSEFALDIRYQKSFSGTSIASRSVEEMKRIGVPDAQAAIWGRELSSILPNVESGQRLTAIYSPKAGTTFYHQGKQIAQIPGADFSKAFFGIWLDPKTSAPKLRTELLGQSCPPPLFNEAC